MAQTKLQRWSDVSQIVSALAVVLSLVYVGSEIRSNTEATRGATRQAILQADLEYLTSALDPQTLLAAEAKLENGVELNMEERFVLVERQHVNFRLFENAYYQYRAGLLIDERWDTYRRIIGARLTGNEPTQAMWTKYRNNFDDEFQREVEAIREAAVPADPDGAL